MHGHIRRRFARRRAARGDVVWCLVSVVSIQLALSVALEAWRPDLRDPEYGHKLALLRRQSAEAPNRPLVLAVGSSRTLTGLRPDALPATGSAVFNFGLSAHGPVQQALAFDRLLRDGIRPRWATIEVMPAMLTWGPRELDLAPVVRHTWGDVRFLAGHALRPPEHAWRWLEARAAPCYASRFTLLNRVFPNWVPFNARQDSVWTQMTPGGWLEQRPAGSAARAAALRATAERDIRSWVTPFAVAPDADRALRLTFARCRAEGIGAVAVLMPEATWFRALPPASAEPQVQAFLTDLRRTFGVSVIDARHWCPDAEFFPDGHHLLAAGAARFTECYAREVLPLLTGEKD